PTSLSFRSACPKPYRRYCRAYYGFFHSIDYDFHHELANLRGVGFYLYFNDNDCVAIAAIFIAYGLSGWILTRHPSSANEYHRGFTDSRLARSRPQSKETDSLYSSIVIASLLQSPVFVEFC